MKHLKIVFVCIGFVGMSGCGSAEQRALPSPSELQDVTNNFVPGTTKMGSAVTTMLAKFFDFKTQNSDVATCGADGLDESVIYPTNDGGSTTLLFKYSGPTTPSGCPDYSTPGGDRFFTSATHQ